MKDAIAYAHEAGFFSFNVIGWKSEFERLIASIRAEYEAPLKLAEEALVYHTRQTRPIHKTDEAIITIRNTLTYLVKTPDVLVSNGNWGGRLDFKCPVCGKEFVSHQAVYSHCQNECKTLVDQCSDANKIVAEQSIVLDDPHPPHRLCECTACLEYWTPLPDCDAFAASGKVIADHIADTDKMVLDTNLLEALREMVSAQHAGPITRKMFSAWKKGKEAIDKAEKYAPVQPVKHDPVAWVNTRYNMAFIQPEGFNVYECDAYKAGELKPTFFAEQMQTAKQDPVAWWELNEDIGAWFLAYTFNPKAKTRPLIFGDVSPVDPVKQETVTGECDSFVVGYDAEQADANSCCTPPIGWLCTRQAGHDGPCAVIEDKNGQDLVNRAMSRLAEPVNAKTDESIGKAGD